MHLYNIEMRCDIVQLTIIAVLSQATTTNLQYLSSPQAYQSLFASPLLTSYAAWAPHYRTLHPQAAPTQLGVRFYTKAYQSPPQTNSGVTNNVNVVPVYPTTPVIRQPSTQPRLPRIDGPPVAITAPYITRDQVGYGYLNQLAPIYTTASVQVPRVYGLLSKNYAPEFGSSYAAVQQGIVYPSI